MAQEKYRRDVLITPKCLPSVFLRVEVAVKKKKEIIKAEQCVPDTWLWEYRIRRTPLRSPSFSKLVVGARGRESLRGSSSILAPTLEESKHRSIRPEQLLLLSSLDGGNSVMFAWPRCAAEFLALLERFYFGYLIGYGSTSRESIFDIYFLRAVRRLFGRLPDIETLIDVYIRCNPILPPFLKSFSPLSFTFTTVETVQRSRQRSHRYPNRFRGCSRWQ